MEQENPTVPKKQSMWKSWKTLTLASKIFLIFTIIFALIGLGICGVWVLYQTGIMNNSGGIDKNNRYLADYKSRVKIVDSNDIYEADLQNYISLAMLNKVYPVNAKLIYKASKTTPSPEAIDRMLYAANLYLKDNSKGKQYQQMMDEVEALFKKYNPKPSDENLIPWMNDSGWVVLKLALTKDADKIKQAAELTGVDARLIAACTVGEQIRLFNSKREDVKRYLGPAVLSVQSQFSYGVNGIKDFTAAQVERNLKDPKSSFYMGEKYENILDYDTVDVGVVTTIEDSVLIEKSGIQAKRFKRLADRDHLYSFIYTGCILHQTMMQWKNAGYDISNRPDILCTLFNLGFQASKPNPEPRCGGSHISVGGRIYTFGVIGNDFFYSGELSEVFPMPEKIFK